MAAFNKSNRQRTVSADHSVVYATSATSTASIPANSAVNVTITVPFSFQGNGQVDATLSAGDSLDTGLALGPATLAAPASGSYSAGNHPRVITSLINLTTAAVTPAAQHDLLIVQY